MKKKSKKKSKTGAVAALGTAHKLKTQSILLKGKVLRGEEQNVRQLHASPAEKLKFFSETFGFGKFERTVRCLAQSSYSFSLN